MEITTDYPATGSSAPPSSGGHSHEISSLTDGGGYVRMTDAERTKLSNLSEGYKGHHLDLAALETAHPTGAAGDWAILLNGEAGSATVALWDADAVPAAWADTAPATVDLADDSVTVAKLAADVDALIASKLPLAGGTLTGPLVLPGAPSAALHAATKDYVDTTILAAIAGVNAADYIVGDGVADDTAAFASALTAAHGKTLYIPSGLIILTGNVTLTNAAPTNIPARVVAYGATLRAKSGLASSSYLLTLENVHGSAPRFRWEGGTIDCDGKCRGVYIHGMQNGYVGSIRVIKSFSVGVDVVGETGYGVYYNMFENWTVGEYGSENGSTGINDYANGSAYYNGGNTFTNCTVQWNKGHGIYIDYSQNNYIACSVEKNDLYGYSLNTTHATTIVGGYSESNHQNWATDHVSDASTDYSFNCVAATTGVKVFGGRHADVNGTATGAGNLFDIAYPGNGGLSYSNGVFNAAGQYGFPATQIPSSNPNTLDDYEEGTWTPDVTFGGGNTGMTFSAREGTYTKIGRHVFGRGSFQMSNKGTSTGVAKLVGIPFAAASGKTSSGVIDYYSGMASFAGCSMEIVGGSAVANYYIHGASSSASANDTNFTNSSSMWFSFHYHV